MKKLATVKLSNILAWLEEFNSIVFEKSNGLVVTSDNESTQGNLVEVINFLDENEEYLDILDYSKSELRTLHAYFGELDATEKDLLIKTLWLENQENLGMQFVDWSDGLQNHQQLAQQHVDNICRIDNVGYGYVLFDTPNGSISINYNSVGIGTDSNYVYLYVNGSNPDVEGDIEGIEYNIKTGSFSDNDEDVVGEDLNKCLELLSTLSIDDLKKAFHHDFDGNYLLEELQNHKQLAQQSINSEYEINTLDEIIIEQIAERSDNVKYNSLTTSLSESDFINLVIDKLDINEIDGLNTEDKEDEENNVHISSELSWLICSILYQHNTGITTDNVLEIQNFIEENFNYNEGIGVFLYEKYSDSFVEELMSKAKNKIFNNNTQYDAQNIWYQLMSVTEQHENVILDGFGLDYPQNISTEDSGVEYIQKIINKNDELFQLGLLGDVFFWNTNNQVFVNTIHINEDGDILLGNTYDSASINFISNNEYVLSGSNETTDRREIGNSLDYIDKVINLIKGNFSFTAYEEDGSVCIGIKSIGFIAEGFDDISEEEIEGVLYLYRDFQGASVEEIEGVWGNITLLRNENGSVHVTNYNDWEETISPDSEEEVWKETLNDYYVGNNSDAFNDVDNESYNTENLLGIWGSWDSKAMNVYDTAIEYPMSDVEDRYDQEDLAFISKMKKGSFYVPEYGNTVIFRVSEEFKNNGIETILGTIMPIVFRNKITEYPNVMLAQLLQLYPDSRTRAYVKYVLQKTTETLKFVNNKIREENNDYDLDGLVNFSVEESPEAFTDEGEDGNIANLGLWILSTYNEKDFNEIFDFDVTKFINDLGCYISNLGNTDELFFSDKL